MLLAKLYYQKTIQIKRMCDHKITIDKINFYFVKKYFQGNFKKSLKKTSFKITHSLIILKKVKKEIFT